MPTPFLLNGILASQISGHLYSGPSGAYDALGSVTVGSGGLSSITFSAIPQTYTHLQIRGIETPTSGGQLGMRINGDSGSNYAYHYINGNGSSAGANNATGSSIMYMNYVVPTSPSYPLAFVMDILDYTNINKNKVARFLSGIDENGTGAIQFSSGLYTGGTIGNSNNTITSLTFNDSGGNFQQYTNFSLYGIR